MVRQTKTIKETVKEAKDFLKNLAPRRVSCSIRDTIKEAAAFLQRDGPLEKRNRSAPKVPERVVQPIKKKIAKQKVPTQKAQKISVQKKVAATKKAQKPSKVQKAVPKVTKKPEIKAKAPQRPVSQAKAAKQVAPAKISEKRQSAERKPVQQATQPKIAVPKNSNKQLVATPAQRKPAEKQKEKVEKKQAHKSVKNTKAIQKRKPSPEPEDNQDHEGHSSDKHRDSSAAKPKQVKKVQKEQKQLAKIEPNNKHEPQQKKQVKKVKPVQEENNDNVNIKEEAQKDGHDLKQEVPHLPRRTQTDRSDPTKPKAGIVDVVFVLDTTGSMDEYLQKIQTTVNTLVQNIKSRTNESDVSVRFGFVAYRDHPPQEPTYLTRVQDLCTSAEVLEFVSGLDCQGGGDGAEAVYDGLNDAAQKINWRDERNVPSLRYIFHIADQPPHGKEYNGYSELWSETGCPCGITLDQLSHRINVNDIHYRLIKASNTLLEPMAKIFKERFLNYDECYLEGEAELMNVRISDMVIRELCPDIDYDG